MKRPKLVEVKGILLHKSTAERWSLISEFKAQPDDLLICSYPKSGTIWVQEIVEMIHFGGDTQECSRAPMYKRMPFLEMPHTLVSCIVGDWKEYFTVAQSEKLDDVCARELGNSGLVFRTQL